MQQQQEDLSITSNEQSYLSKSRSKEEIIDVFMRLQQGINLYEEENQNYKQQIQKLIDTNKQIEDNNKAELLHLETVNMMTKYQIVFLKLETSMFNIHQNTNQRQIIRMKKAFDKFKQNAHNINNVTKHRQNLSVLKFESSLQLMCNTLHRYTHKQLAIRGFVQWKLHTKIQQHSDKLNQQAKQTQSKLNQELDKVNNRLKDAYQQVKNSQDQINVAQMQLDKHKTDLNEKERQISAQKQREGIGSQNGQGSAASADSYTITRKQNIYNDLIQLNHQLKSQLQQANHGIGDYISEMSTLLDSAELSAALNMELANDSSDEAHANNIEGDHDYDEQFDDNEARPHAGTGGSSKLRSRPELNTQQNNQLSNQAR